jgi:hypothetical protein
MPQEAGTSTKGSARRGIVDMGVIPPSRLSMGSLIVLARVSGRGREREEGRKKGEEEGQRREGEGRARMRLVHLPREVPEGGLWIWKLSLLVLARVSGYGGRREDDGEGNGRAGRKKGDIPFSGPARK